MTMTVFAEMVKTQSPVGGLPKFARTALTVASDGCYWAVTDLKRGHDRKKWC